MNPYYDKMEETTFTSHVLSCTKQEDGYHVILEASAFYVEKGGMASDTGTLNEMPVIHVYEQEQAVVHVVEQPLSGIVHGVVDFEQRLWKCQIHTAQHLLSYYMEKHYPVMTISHHAGSDGSQILFSWQQSAMELDLGAVQAALEAYANAQIRKDLAVEICYPAYEEFKDRQKKTNFQEHDVVRVVKVAEDDYNFCGCLHVPRTSYIQGVAVLALERTKDGLLVCYQAGMPLLAQYKQQAEMLKTLGERYKVPAKEVLNAVLKQGDSKNQLEQEVHRLRMERLELKALHYLQTTNEDDYIIDELEATPKEGQILASMITKERRRVALLCRQEEQCHVLFACQKEMPDNMREVYQVFAARHGFKGGGSASMAQGGGRYHPNYKQELLKQLKGE